MPNPKSAGAKRDRGGHNSPAAKLALIRRVLSTAYEDTEVWSEDSLGTHLAYLVLAICDAGQDDAFVDWSPELQDPELDRTRKSFENWFRPDDPVWKFIRTEASTTMNSLKVVNGRVCLDWEELRDVLGVPYDCSVAGPVVILSLRHVDAIVAAHGPRGVYVRNVAVALRALPHVVRVTAKGDTITMEFDVPVEVG